MTMLSCLVREELISSQTIQLYVLQTLSSFHCVPENNVFVDNLMGMCVIMIWEFRVNVRWVNCVEDEEAKLKYMLQKTCVCVYLGGGIRIGQDKVLLIVIMNF